MKNIRFIAIVLTALLVTTLCIPIFMLHVAGEENIVTITLDIALGSISITDTGYECLSADGTIVSSGTLTEGENYRFVITQSNYPEPTANHIEVKASARQLEIELAGVNIQRKDSTDENKTGDEDTCAFYADLEASAQLAVILQDGTANYLYSGRKRAGLEKSGGTKKNGTLIISCEQGYEAWKKDHTKGHTDANGYSACENCGILDARSGNAWRATATEATYIGGAGIGTRGSGNNGSDQPNTVAGTNALQNLTIAGGKIFAMGARGQTFDSSSGGGANIGVGASTSSSTTAGTITGFYITGGNITTYRTDNSAACIGGGYRSGYVNMTIYGGTISAIDDGTEKTYTTLTNVGRARAAGIGGGGGGTSSASPAGATVNIYGGHITATSRYGAAIGSGAGGSSGDGQIAYVNIYGGTIFATTKKGNGNGAGAAIGAGGSLGTGYGGAAYVVIQGGTIVASSELGADIGGGGTNSTAAADGGGTADVKILGGDITTTSGGIGGGRANAGAGGNATVTISGGTINASSIGGGSSKGKKNGGEATVTVSGDAHIILQGTIGGGDCTGSGAGGNATVEVCNGYLECGDIGGGNSTGGNGGAAEIIVSGGTLKAKSIGGGSTQSTEKSIGYASANISGGEITGQFIMAAGGTAPCAFTMIGGRLFGVDATTGEYTKFDGGAIYMDDPKGIVDISGGTIENCKAENGGAIYMTNGKATISGTATIQNCSATENGGAIYMGGGTLTMSGGILSSNKALNGAGAYLASGSMKVLGDAKINNNVASTDGGAAYLAGGSFAMSNGTISGNTAQNGAGAFVADGNVTVEGGLIENNIAAQNGGAFSISNGGYTMTGGTLNGNRATSGNGGAIYISSSEDTAVTVRSGSITNNFAGTSGGALAVVGQAEVTLTITIGSNTDHTDRVDCHAKAEGNADEACPIIKENNSLTSGGGIYLAGSYTAKMNMYCLVEENNTAGNGVSTSNFMKIEGGTLNISTNEGGANNGNIKIDSTIHVTGGRVSISGSADNTNFVKAITVEVKEAKDFVDNRQDGAYRTILYFENAPGGSGKYQLIDHESDGAHTVRANEFNIPGYNMVGWERRVWDAFLQDYVDANDRIYNAEDLCAVEGNLVFFAKWEIITYVIKFSPNSTSYNGKMDDLSFNLDEPQTLTLNKYVVVGQMFVQWEWIGAPEGYSSIFADGAEFTWPTDTITEITLVAKWTLCDHQNLEKYNVTITASSATRKCQCQTFTESISITGINGVYNKGVYEVIPTYSAISSNGADAQPIWKDKQNAVQYSGVSNAGKEPNGAPIDAGNYTASIILDETHTLEVTIFIDRAERTEFPAEPQYDVTVNNKGTVDTSDDENVIVIKPPQDSKGLVLEYLFSWYENDVLCTSNDDNLGWDPWDAENPPMQKLSVLYTNYYVEVRYAQDDNYKASQSTVGAKVIFFEGNVVFAIRSKDNALVYSRIDPQEIEGKKEGILITLVPKNDSYYIYNILKEMTATYTDTGDAADDYQLPAMSVEKASSDEWVIRIYDVKDSSKPITINVAFLGAEKKVVIDSSAARDEVFTDIEKGEDDVAISNDSAYTVRFDVENYKHYQSPSITFGEALPVGTTIIMKDIANSSYWSYTVSLEGITSVSLDKFFRMGTKNQSFVVGGESFTLQFAIDFSNCEEALPIDTILATSLTAESVIPDAGSIEILSGVTVEAIGKNIPTFTAKKDIEIVGAPSFSLAPSDTASQNQLSQALSYQFAYTKEANVGVSKWSSISGILIVTPTNPTILPPDARLEVKIGNSTDIYPLVNGCFMVALPKVGSETATLALLSDMLPNETKTFGFTVRLYASATMVKTTPTTALSSEVEVTYQTIATVIPTISVQIKDGVLPKYENESITPLAFEGVLKNVPDGCTVRALLYRKNEYGRYAYTLTSLNGGDNGNNGSFYIEEGTGNFAGVLQLTSFAEGMKIAEGSLSLRLDIEVVDQTGKVINSVPLYFILIDTRQ